MIFAEALHTLDDYRSFTRAVDVPVLANLTEFGLTPLLHGARSSGRAGVKMMLYPLSAFRAMSHAALARVRAMRARRHADVASSTAMQTREELYAVLDYHAYERKLDELFAASTASAANKRARHQLRSKRKKT